MDEKHDIEELIDLYVANRMTPDQRAAFEERMRRDPELVREVELTRHIANAIERRSERDALEELERIGSVAELKRLINKTERRASQGPAKHRGMLRQLLPFAAAAAAILGFVWIGMQPEHASEKLYDRWHETPEYAPAISRGGVEIGTELERLLDSASIYYVAGDWDKAIAVYDRGSGQEYPDYARFYRAAALAEAGRSEEAVAELELLAQNPGSDYAAEAAWQLALEYLRRGDRAQAEQTLEALISKEDAYADDARRLLKELNVRKWF